VLKHGGKGGKAHGPLEISEGVWITKVSGSVAKKDGSMDIDEKHEYRVHSIKIELSNGANMSAGFERDTKFDITAAKGHYLIGFKGHSGSGIDQIQATFFNFHPTVWVQ